MMNELERYLMGAGPLMLVLVKITAVLCLGMVAHWLMGRFHPQWRVLVWRAVAMGMLMVLLTVLVGLSVDIEVIKIIEPITF